MHPWNLPDDVDFRLTLVTAGGETATMEKASFPEQRREQGDGAGVFVFEGAAGGLPVKAELTCRADGAEWLVELSVKAADGLRIESVLFPLVSVTGVLPADRLLMPSGYGDEIDDPVRTIQLYGRRRRRPPPKGLTFVDNTDDEVIYHYPACAGVQYMVACGAGRCSMVACYDATGGDSKAFRARAAGAGKLVLSVQHWPAPAAQRNWRSPLCSAANLAGDWHAAADVYRKRMQPLLSGPELPRWIVDRGFHGWISTPMQIEGQPPSLLFRDLPDVMRRCLDHGFEVLHIYGWAGRGHDTLYPDYLPDEELGTAAELRKALDEIRGLGGRSMLYTNGKLVDEESRFFRTGGGAACVLGADGLPARENYGTRSNFQMGCPGSRQWREHFVGVARRLVGEYGAGGLQIDQIASTPLPACGRTDHDHAGAHDNAMLWAERMMREVRDACREIDPGFFVWVEGCQERIGQFFDVHQGSYGEGGMTAFSVTVGRALPEQFRFTWPAALDVGSANDLQSISRTMLQGKPLDVGIAVLDSAPVLALLLRCLQLRQALARYYVRGTYRGGVGVAPAGPARASVIEGDGGGRLLSVWMPGAAAGEGTRAAVLCDFPLVGLTAHCPDGATLRAEDSLLRLEFAGPLAIVEVAEQ